MVIGHHWTWDQLHLQGKQDYICKDPQRKVVIFKSRMWQICKCNFIGAVKTVKITRIGCISILKTCFAKKNTLNVICESRVGCISLHLTCFGKTNAVNVIFESRMGRMLSARSCPLACTGCFDDCDMCVLSWLQKRNTFKASPKIHFQSFREICFDGTNVISEVMFTVQCTGCFDHCVHSNKRWLSLSWSFNDCKIVVKFLCFLNNCKILMILKFW